MQQTGFVAVTDNLDSWVWAYPQLEPMEFSLVVWTGDGNSACFVKGNNEVFLPRNVTSGCVDGMIGVSHLNGLLDNV